MPIIWDRVWQVLPSQVPQLQVGWRTCLPTSPQFRSKFLYPHFLSASLTLNCKFYFHQTKFCFVCQIHSVSCVTYFQFHILILFDFQDGQTVLHVAASAGRLETVEALLDRGCDSNVQDFVSAFNILHHAPIRAYSHNSEFCVCTYNWVS